MQLQVQFSFPAKMIPPAPCPQGPERFQLCLAQWPPIPASSWPGSAATFCRPPQPGKRWCMRGTSSPQWLRQLLAFGHRVLPWISDKNNKIIQHTTCFKVTDKGPANVEIKLKLFCPPESTSECHYYTCIKISQWKQAVYEPTSTCNFSTSET